MFIYVFISFVLLVELKKYIYMNIQKSPVVEVFVEVGEEVRICLYLFSFFLSFPSLPYFYCRIMFPFLLFPLLFFLLWLFVCFCLGLVAFRFSFCFFFFFFLYTRVYRVIEAFTHLCIYTHTPMRIECLFGRADLSFLFLSPQVLLY